MAPSIPDCEPKTLIAGDRCQWTRTLRDYSADAGDVLSYDVVGASGQPFTISTTGSGSTFTVDTKLTSGLAGGTYEWRARITNGVNRVTVGRGTFWIEDNTPVVNGDEALLAAIDARIANRALDSGADIASYTIGNRSITRIPMPELLAFRGVIAARIWRARNPRQAFPEVAAGFHRAR